ncbi:MAG: tetratricopeptide repeat protein [Chthoniobacterales bacterium]|nr:tetratricopeptide repeat protein [Chthoniobacterales bacterium]
MNLKNFFAELKRRNVYKVAVAYAVVAWLVVEIATATFPVLEIPNWATKLVIAVVMLGFPVALVLAWAFELTPEGVKRAEDVPPEQSITRRTGHALKWIIAVAAACAVALFWFTHSPKQPAGGELDRSIAVLPFDNRSADPADAYFADGIQDEIITRLAKIEDLKVISRTSTLEYKEKRRNVRQIATELGVAYLLEAGVQRAGDRVRLNVQLINAARDQHVWAEIYDRKITDIFEVQSDLAAKVAESLHARIARRDLPAVAAPSTTNPDAYDAYLRGLAGWNKLTTAIHDHQNILAHLERAVQLDAQFAEAWALLSAVNTLSFAEFDRTPQRLGRAKEALDQAQRLATNSGDTNFALGLYRYRGLADYDGALAAFEKAREHSSNRVAATEFSAYVKRRQGKWDESLALHRQALELDPRNPILLSEAALTYRALGRFNEARERIDRALELEPNNVHLLVQKAETYQAEGDFDTAGKLLEQVPFDPREDIATKARLRQWLLLRDYGRAIEALRRVLAAPEDLAPVFIASYRGRLGAAEKLAGNASAAQRELSRARDELDALVTAGDRNPMVITDLLLVCALLGDKAGVERAAALLQNDINNDALAGPSMLQMIAAAQAQLGESNAAIATLSRAVAARGEGSLTPALLRADPLWDPLRDDPRFQQLLNGTIK